MFGWKMQKYVYRVLYKLLDNDWELLTPCTGKSKLYTRTQDAMQLIHSQPKKWRVWDDDCGWKYVPVVIEYKIQKALIGEWEDEGI